jgi:hypothetical protein
MLEAKAQGGVAGTMKRRRSPQLLHPLTLASYPALALYVANADQIEPSSMLRSWLASIALAVLLLATYRFAYRDSAKAALAASLSLIAFFAYGHLYAELKQLGPLAAALIRHRYFLPLVLGLLALALLWIRRLADAAGLQRLFSAAGVALLVLPLVRLGYFQLESARMRSSASSSGAGCTLRPPEDAQLPDIYLVIMDAYERDDVLWEMHGYDNTPFLRELELRGFYVARGSLSNYRHTELSVTSLLNLDYIQSFPESYSPESQNRVGLIELLKHSRLRRELECLGYSTVTLETGAVWTEWRDADYFISREAGVLHQLQFLGGLTRFESFLLRSTMARAALDLSTQLASPETALSNDPVERTRERILFEFDQLEQVPALPGPKLVFVHIISPHPPFVFGPNGEYVSKAEFETDSSGRPLERTLLDAYADQVQYLNGRLLSAVDRILAGSGVPPVIIIQGDHGWAERNAEDKLSILNVYYFPDGDYSDLYPTITPVNSFRVVLNRYLGGNFELLEDVSYFSTEEDVFRFEVVENRWESQEGP